MALVKKSTLNTRLIIIAVVIIAVAGIGYLLYQRLVLNAGTGNETVNVSSGTHGVITNFGEGILNDSRYTELKPYGSNLNAGESGQPNPFQ